MILRMLFIAVTLLCTLNLHADKLKMTDGRLIEGEIIREDHGMVVIDAMISDIRAKLSFPIDEIEKVTREPVADDFYERKDLKPDKRVSDSAKFKSNDAIYLEIPVHGKIGVDFESKSLARIIAYAKRYRIEHLVFTVNSAEGGNIDEARRISKMMRFHQERFTYHVLVSNCLGDALAVAINSDQLVILPKGKIGGLDTSLKADKDPNAKFEDEMVLRQQMAIDVEKYMNQRGRPGMIVRAMIDPNASLVAWINESGEPEFDTVLSGMADESKVIFEAKAGKSLVLSAEQAQKLGAPKFSGTVEEYGSFKNIANWKKESDYAEKLVSDNARLAEKRELVVAKRYDSQIRRNIERREETKRNLEHHLEGASKWDPKKVKLSTKSYPGGWGWSGRRRYYDGGNYGGSYNTNQLTDQSRAEYIRHTDAALQHLAHAVRAIGVMKQLDKEAKKLGLETTYNDGELEQLHQDIKVRFAALKANRGKSTK